MIDNASSLNKEPMKKRGRIEKVQPHQDGPTELIELIKLTIFE